jgi:hypothetical protein
MALVHCEREKLDYLEKKGEKYRSTNKDTHKL